MRLAQTITLKLGGKLLELNPTLRAAVVLERAHGLDTLGGKIVEGNLTAIADTIAATAFGPWEAEEVMALLLSSGLDTAMRVAPDLLGLLGGLAGIDPDAEEAEEKRTAAEPVTIAEAQRTLFRLGTGKLGWTPAATWGATPLEILEAWHGRRELLRDIFGGADDTPKASAGNLDDKFAALIMRNAAIPGAQTADA